MSKRLLYRLMVLACLVMEVGSMAVASEPPPPQNLDIPIDDASGARYRKIALNGLPMTDEKPQQSAESDQEKEETYIDSLTLGLRHSTTDAYIPVSGSDFSVSARRDFRSQVWSQRYGLRPVEQPDLPFGMCWSSNLAANIKFVEDDDNPNATTPDQAIVTDETGAVHTFCIEPGGSGNVFFPMPTAKNEAQVPNMETLTFSGGVYTFKRRYGATLTYNPLRSLTETKPDDRLKFPSLYSTTYAYARLTKAEDRVGNIVNYNYPSGDTTSLVPSTITVANQPDLSLTIVQEPISTAVPGDSNPQNVIASIQDANGNTTTFGYSPAPSITSPNDDGDEGEVVLTSVTTPDGARTNYTYNNEATETDLMPHASGDPTNNFFYVDIASITDPLGNAYSFQYAFDHSKFNYTTSPRTCHYIIAGCPRNIAQVTMPDSTTAHPDVATFTNKSAVFLGPTIPGDGPLDTTSSCSDVYEDSGSFPFQRESDVTDATGFTRTYTFSDVYVVRLPSLVPPSSFPGPLIMAYQQLDIAYGITTGPGGVLGSETITFDIDASMALKSVKDFSGNTTTYAHGDSWPAPTDYSSILTDSNVNEYYPDPTMETDALTYTKTFTYDRGVGTGAGTPANPGSGIMTDVTDENGNHTHYNFDAKGRRTAELIYAPPVGSGSETLVQETDFYYDDDATYPGFMTKKCVKALGGSDPSWVKPLVTEYTPDGDGRVAQETVDPGGSGHLNLITAYTYDNNGNKLTTTDPNSHTTTFTYDSRNRLTKVTYADTSYKVTEYDLRGNKTVEYDENNVATLYQYDSLNRLVTQARHMAVGSVESLRNAQGDVTTIPSGDLVTSYTYNKVNSKLTTTDPNTNVTKMCYDHLQRVTKITDAAGNATTFAYDKTLNTGGDAFDSSSFKPTTTTDPRGFTTTVTYDACYHPTSKAVQYTLSTMAPSTTTMTYDKAGNVIETKDPLTNKTDVTYDALNRPLVTTYADHSTTQMFYTSTGFKWSVIDPDGNETRTQYDNAGRPVSVTAGIVGGTVTPACPVTTTSYDAAGNAASTTNPLGNVWNYTYDSRNRKLTEAEPSVLDATTMTSSNPTLTWGYDAVGNVIKTIDARGNETDMTYDAANRVIEIDQPAVTAGTPKTFTTYDNNGNVLTVKDPDGNTTTNTYDALNRLLTTTDALSITVTNTYDSVGNKLTVEDGDLHTTTFAYDGMNRLLTTTDAAGNVTTFDYNALNKTERVDALGQETQYSYDVRERLSGVTYTGRSADNRVNTYDSCSNLLTVVESGTPAADVAYTYDPLNRVVGETVSGPGGIPIAHVYMYDTAGNRTKTIYGHTGRTITSTYDVLNRLSTMQEQSAAEVIALSPGRTTTYGYDLNGNIVQKTAPNGDTEAYSYDALNRATDEKINTASLTSEYGYAYDLVGNVTSIVETYPSGLNNRTVTNTYDAINRLTVEAVSGTGGITTTYTYDAANNRTQAAITGGSTTNYVINNLNQTTSSSDGTRTEAWTFDANGNASTCVVTGGSDNGTDTYSYDYENRLVGLVKGTAGGAGTYIYEYDYRTRRVFRYESSPGPGVATTIVFSGGTSVQEYDDAHIPFLTVEYIRGSDYGGGVGGILYSIRSGVPSYTHANRRGDVVAKTSSTGVLTCQVQYDAYGKQIATTGATLDRQKSNSKETDPTGLVDEGYRYRRGQVFLTRDPAGMIDGPNEYCYVSQNPWTKFDPEGLSGTLYIETNSNGNDGSSLVTGSTDTGTHSWVSFQSDKPGTAETSYGTFGNSAGRQGVQGVNTDTEMYGPYVSTQSRSMHVDDKQENQFNSYVDSQKKLGDKAWTYQDPCSTFAANAWNAGTGEKIDPRDGTKGVGPYGSSTPKLLGDNIKKANGGKDDATVTPTGSAKQTVTNNAAQTAAASPAPANASPTAPTTPTVPANTTPTTPSQPKTTNPAGQPNAPPPKPVIKPPAPQSPA